MSLPAGQRQYLHVVAFLGCYLGLSVVPYAALHWSEVRAVVDGYYPPGPVGLAVWTLGSALLLVGLLVANQGVERYVQFLFWPTDPLAALVDASYVWAAVSWWALPEIAAAVDASPTLLGYLVGVVASHVPAVVFLSLLTAVGEAHRPEKPWNR
mgnify:CR=1 FL=1